MGKRKGNLDYNLDSILELWGKLLDNEHVRETLKEHVKDGLERTRKLSECRKKLKKAIDEKNAKEIKNILQEIFNEILYSMKFKALTESIKKAKEEDLTRLGKMISEIIDPQTPNFNEEWIKETLNFVKSYQKKLKKEYYKYAQNNLGELFGRAHIDEHFILNGCSKGAIRALLKLHELNEYNKYENCFNKIKERYLKVVGKRSPDGYPINLEIDAFFNFLDKLTPHLVDLKEKKEKIESLSFSSNELRMTVKDLEDFLGISSSSQEEDTKKRKKKRRKDIKKTLEDIKKILEKKILVIVNGEEQGIPSGIYVIKEITEKGNGDKYQITGEKVLEFSKNLTPEIVENLKNVVEHTKDVHKKDTNKAKSRSTIKFLNEVIKISSGAIQEKTRSEGKNKREEKEKERRKVRTRNIILYGPVGTGKTLIAKAFCPGGPEVKGNGKNVLEEIRELTGIQGEVQGHEFITFHKSYSYEEFIEGIRPIVNENGEINYVIFDGIFKKLCLRAITSAIVQATKEEDLEKEMVREERIVEIAKSLQGLLEKEELDAKEHEEYLSLKRQLWNWIREKLKEEEGRKLLEKIFKNAPPHILIIDEINRGDPSRIFGELLTLIEDNKRIGEKEAMTATLPYSRELFGAPSNLYIIGTMNTTDRSIALLDMALRRRFTFIEVLPNEEILNGTKIGGIDLGELLKKLNEGIRRHKDLDHQLGHAFLMGVETEDDLVRAWNYKIAPFLEEVFYSDPEGLKGVLGPSLLEGEEEVKKVKRFDRDSKEDLIKALTSLVGTENKQEGQNA